MLPAHGPAQLLSRHRQQRTSGRAASCIAARTPGLCARWHPCRLRLQGAPTRRAICALSSSIEDAPTDSDDSSPAAPWSEDELTELTRQARAEEEAEIGDEWRSMFMDNPMRQLFTYAMEDFAAWLVSEDAPIVTPPAEEAPDAAAEPSTSGQDTALELQSSPNMGLPGPYELGPPGPSLINEFIGLGMWRLRGVIDPCIAFMVQRIEGTWRECFADDLSLYPRDKWKQYDICDSQDPHRELEGWSYADMPAPAEGEEGYPRLVLENRVYYNNVFRKLHLEIGARQDGLQVLHCVLYPRYNYDLPILGIDMVMKDGRVSLGIIDACPISPDLSLPDYYLQTMEDLQQVFLGPDAAAQRRIPEWGQRIFSKGCVCIAPDTPEKLARFTAYAAALHRAHCLLAKLVKPISRSVPGNQTRLKEILDGHKRFIDNQLANKKTSRVLETAFGTEWSDRYMREMMFDYTPTAEPPLQRDGEFVRLYQYFDQHPALGQGPQQLQALEEQVALQRAQETIQNLYAGEGVRQDKAEEAFMTMFFLDTEFQQSCLQANPEFAHMEGSEVGAILLREFEMIGLGKAAERWTSVASSAART